MSPLSTTRHAERDELLGQAGDPDGRRTHVDAAAVAAKVERDADEMRGGHGPGRSLRTMLLASCVDRAILWGLFSSASFAATSVEAPCPSLSGPCASNSSTIASSASSRPATRKSTTRSTNVGGVPPTSIILGTAEFTPDLILVSNDKARKLEGVVEVETGESVNSLETLAQWSPFSRLRVPFHLYVPPHTLDTVRRLCREHNVTVAELWTYHTNLDQVRFTLIQKATDAAIAAARKAGLAGTPRLRVAAAASAATAATPTAAAPAAAYRRGQAAGADCRAEGGARAGSWPPPRRRRPRRPTGRRRLPPAAHARGQATPARSEAGDAAKPATAKPGAAKTAAKPAARARQPPRSRRRPPSAKAPPSPAKTPPPTAKGTSAGAKATPAAGRPHRPDRPSRRPRQSPASPRPSRRRQPSRCVAGQARRRAKPPAASKAVAKPAAPAKPLAPKAPAQDCGRQAAAEAGRQAGGQASGRRAVQPPIHQSLRPRRR